mmetsp:Transcript_119295/g.338248  ORF Transcript_119295/g.338248 Transcript_119295/m.338248 type:complete len:203 (+) Transcript_119295:392-1000(+)
MDTVWNSARLKPPLLSASAWSRSCCRSPGMSFSPAASMPCFSSATVSSPSPFASSALNDSVSFETSFSVSWLAMTRAAALWSLGMYRNPRSLSMKTLSSCTFFPFGALSATQTCISACSAVYRSLGFFFSRPRIRFLASSDTFFQSVAWKANFASVTLRWSSASVSPKNGGYPQSMMNMRTPQLHRSHRWEDPLASASGATW